ncbi:MAG: hypothetical protein KJ904_06340 [Alphaproteobacteria bacterium]|nr:hypothetical protein [Alphaproteobacteria bacterium]MBU0796414.1 hypothetical protein [Alphaproteobacteria bacterium]MBU0886765.1 hypothetical protein [Alphaproteobacteria bacterium]MBU1812622.1 hypothetical protein [Alphaproteobacteria bacterium]MBU2089042.1 hypothetical protein [Alphaproteobacteria bacterium]
MIIASLLFAASTLFVAVLMRYSRRANPPAWVNSWLVTDVATAMAIGLFALSIGFAIEFFVTLAEQSHVTVELSFAALTLVGVVIAWRWCLRQAALEKAGPSGMTPAH